MPFSLHESTEGSETGELHLNPSRQHTDWLGAPTSASCYIPYIEKIFFLFQLLSTLQLLKAIVRGR